MTKYQGYDVTDATHKTSIHNDWKVVVAKKKTGAGCDFNHWHIFRWYRKQSGEYSISSDEI